MTAIFRDRAIILASLVAVAGLSWAYLFGLSQDMASMDDMPGTATVMLSCFVAVAGVAAESRTCTVKVALPLAVGVPEITPVEAFRVSPTGSVPTVIDHE